jgi:hypothetical protein
MVTDHWEWPDELDALTAAPGNHDLLLENDRVRVLLTTIPIGAATPVHTHHWPSVEYLITASDFVRRDADGNVLLDTRVADSTPEASDVLWSDPFPPHSLENVGDTELRVIMVEIKARAVYRPRARDSSRRSAVVTVRARPSRGQLGRCPSPLPLRERALDDERQRPANQQHRDVDAQHRERPERL